MISCLLFDFDGTLADSSEANIRSYAKAFEKVGLQFDKRKYIKLFGLRFLEMMDQIAPNSTEKQRSEIRSLKAKYYRDYIHLVQLNNGLLDLVRSLNGRYKTGLITTASRRNVESFLEHFAIDPILFNIIITGEDVRHGKPNPECYTKAIEALGEEPTNCLVFEDSQVGIEAAVAAGAKVVKIAI